MLTLFQVLQNKGIELVMKPSSINSGDIEIIPFDLQLRSHGSRWGAQGKNALVNNCLLYTSPSPRDS